MTEKKKDELAVVDEKTQALSTQQEEPMGFDEDDDSRDMIIPRVKVAQTLSPERKDGLVAEGDIFNSLTSDKLNGKVFIPVFKFTNHILWRSRTEGGGMLCMAKDGKHGEETDGTQLLCAQCRKFEFDNTKQGKEAIPKCTRYINFFGFFEGDRLPVILSFSKTNYNEGKKMYSLAKVTMQNMWNYGYKLDAKLIAKHGNEWYIIIPSSNGKTSDEDRDFGLQLFKTFRSQLQDLNIDMEERMSDGTNENSGASDDEPETEY